MNRGKDEQAAASKASIQRAGRPEANVSVPPLFHTLRPGRRLLLTLVVLREVMKYPMQRSEIYVSPDGRISVERYGKAQA